MTNRDQWCLGKFTAGGCILPYDCVLRRAFKKEANKPTLLDVTAVHDWEIFFVPDMAATRLRRLAVSADSGEA